MPPGPFSRYLRSEQLTDEQGRIYLGGYEPFPYVDLPDNRRHTIVQGDTLWSLSERAFPGIPDAAMLFWAVADFQPEPILDPTVALAPGRVLFFPSIRTLTEQILNPSRAQD